MNQLKQMRQYLRDENKKFGPALREVLRSEWTPEMRALADAHAPEAPVRIWRSRDFVVQLYADRKTNFARLSVNRSAIDYSGGWQDGITWDDLHRLKGEAGYANHWAVECFPPIAALVNVSNIRHLWLLPEKPAFAW